MQYSVVEITGPADHEWTVSDPPVEINPRCVSCGLEECVNEVECVAKYLEDLKEADENENNEVQTNIESINAKYAYSSFCLRMPKCQRRKDQDSGRKNHRLQKLMLTIAASLIPRLIVTLFYSRIFYVFIQMYPRECPSAPH